ncbi:hypothetical protein ACFLT8_04765 [Chloroflexota bacterium]
MARYIFITGGVVSSVGKGIRVSCPFHSEFSSHSGRPHPLFRDFIGVTKDVLREGAQPPLPFRIA